MTLFTPDRLARPEIVAMSPYESARSQVSHTDDLLLLDANELQIKGSAPFRLYPEPEPQRLLEAICRIYRCPKNAVFVGPGADSAIDALMRVFITPYQDSILITPPTYGYYSVAAKIQGGGIIEVPLRGSAFLLDRDGICKSLDENSKLVFVCSPNNPTGHAFKNSELIELANTIGNEHMLVVDEAYSEFSSEPSLLTQFDVLPRNVVILRTFSKAYGLAGLRLGVAIGDPRVISLMKKVRAPYPIPGPVIDLAIPEIERDIAPYVQGIKDERERLVLELGTLPAVRQVFPSEGNFIFAEFYDANAAFAVLRHAGIIVRQRRDIPNFLRITVGTKDDNQRVLAELRKLNGYRSLTSNPAAPYELGGSHG